MNDLPLDDPSAFFADNRNIWIAVRARRYLL